MIARPNLLPTVYVPSGVAPDRVVARASGDVSAATARISAHQLPADSNQRKSPMSRMSPASGLMPAAAVLLLLSIAACGNKDASATTAEAPVTVLVGPEAIAVAARTTLSTGPELSGTLVAERTAQIRAEVPGSVVQVLVDPGARVTKGMSLAKIDDRAINDLYLSARSGLTAAQTSADIAVRELDRATKLAGAGAISDRDVENARRANLAAMSMLDDAKARLASAQKQLDATNVLSPYDGVVSERAVNPGDVVAPGAPLFTVVDPATMRLEAAVPAEELSQVRVGAPVRFSVTGYPNRTFEGRVSNVNPAADPQTRQVRLFVRIPNAGNQLVAGLFASGRVATESRETLTIPAAAVDLRGLSPMIVRLRNGLTERGDVTLGARDEATERVEILSGLQAGDTVLVGAALGISAGTPLKVNVPSDQPRDTTKN
jgi:membrane fusion protein (multidrug efflux system)